MQEKLLVEDAAGIDDLLVHIDIGPDSDHRFQVFGVKAGDLVLAHGEVRHAPQADVSVRPRLLTSPIDRVAIGLSRADAPDCEFARAHAHPRAVHPHDDIALRHPVCRVDAFMILEHLSVGIPEVVALFHLFMRFEIGFVADGVVVERAAIGTAIHDDRIGALLGRPVNVGVDV